MQVTYNIKSINKALKTKDQIDSFFQQGHPLFLIPDFNKQPVDIWLSFMDFMETKHGEIYDQNGGAVEEYEIINADTGLIKCKYVAYEISFEENDEEKDYVVEITGYIIQSESVYFAATEVKFSE